MHAISGGACCTSTQVACVVEQGAVCRQSASMLRVLLLHNASALPTFAPLTLPH